MVVINFENSRFESGYWRGFRQPAFVFDVTFIKKTIRRRVLEQYDRIIEDLLPAPETHAYPAIVKQHPLLDRLATTSMDILSIAGMPVMSGANALQIDRSDGTHWLLGLSAVSAQMAAPKLAISWSARLLNSLESGVGMTIEWLRQDLQKLITACQRQSPAGTNTLRFLQAAHDEDIPWRHVANNVYQFGWGSRARWLDSSFTDETSRISAGLARDKLACAKILREAGLPVPLHSEAKSAQQALTAAESLGYPVVIKPADLDGGLGVFTSLQTPAAVLKAYAITSKLSKRILVEQHIEGNDYRLQVCNGEVLWAMHRRPAYVVGDGQSTVEELIHLTKRGRKTPTSAAMAEQGRKPIVLDDEVQDWLAKQRLALASVPAPGRHVRLRGAANVNSGGTREAALHHVHPDNLSLAARAASILRLDLAGIDLLIPDISRSWIEGGAVICEVNAQPQISRHLHRLILPRLLSGNGRIPVVVIIGMADGQEKMQEMLVRLTLDENIRLGWVETDHTSLAGEVRPMPGVDVHASCRALLADNSVDAIIWKLPAWPTPGGGVPFDRVDLIVHMSDEEQPVNMDYTSSQAGAQLKDRAARIWSLRISTSCEDRSRAFEGMSEQVATLITENVKKISSFENRDVH